MAVAPALAALQPPACNSCTPAPRRRHSLGGALANIAAARQEQAQRGSVGGVFTYGGPRVGDASWKQAYADLGLHDKTHRQARGREKGGGGGWCWQQAG